MESQPPSANGSSAPESLPPVQPPSAMFILQLFIVPAILVTVVIGFIIFFFGWVGAGPQTPEQFMEGLRNPSELKRWKTAQDLAQVLLRKQELRTDVKFALDMSDLLQAEMQKPPPAVTGDQQAGAADLLEFLPAAVGTFDVPVGVPLLAELALTAGQKVSDPSYRLRLRNAVVALALLGARMKEFDALPEAERERILISLKTEAGDRRSPREIWAGRAYDYLTHRENRQGEPDEGSTDLSGVVNPLAATARAPDELTRKYTILALANWDEPGVESLLLQLTGDQSDIPDEGFEHPDTRPFQPQDRVRGDREIRYNAALALARRGSAMTPWDLVMEALDEETLASGLYADNPGMAFLLVRKALLDVAELKKAHPAVYAAHPEVGTAVRRIADHSPSIALQVEAQRLLTGGADSAAAAPRGSREVLLLVGVGGAVLVLLGLAVFARWSRQSAQTAESTRTGTGS